MTETLDLDKGLLDEVESKSGIKDVSEAVNLAMKEYVRVQNLKPLLDMAGTVDFDEDWDYRKSICKA
jgi:hypothetical protein